MSTKLIVSILTAAFLISATALHLGLSHVEQLPCGHFVRRGGLIPLRGPHGCDATNMLSEMNAIRAAVIYYTEIERAEPLSLEDLYRMDYLGRVLEERSPWDYSLVRQDGEMLVEGRNGEGVRIRMRTNASYTVERPGKSPWHSNLEVQEGESWMP